MNQTTRHAEEPSLPGERLDTQFSPEQRGWMTVALVAFLGVAVVGPAIAAASASGRRLGMRAGVKARQVGAGAARGLGR